MSIIDQLASSLGRRDEVPNQELAEKIAAAKDKKAVKDLVDNLANKNKDIQSDCIKVLYEIGERSLPSSLLIIKSWLPCSTAGTTVWYGAP